MDNKAGDYNREKDNNREKESNREKENNRKKENNREKAFVWLKLKICDIWGRCHVYHTHSAIA